MAGAAAVAGAAAQQQQQLGVDFSLGVRTIGCQNPPSIIAGGVFAWTVALAFARGGELNDHFGQLERQHWASRRAREQHDVRLIPLISVNPSSVIRLLLSGTSPGNEEMDGIDRWREGEVDVLIEECSGIRSTDVVRTCRSPEPTLVRSVCFPSCSYQAVRPD